MYLYIQVHVVTKVQLLLVQKVGEVVLLYSELVSPVVCLQVLYELNSHQGFLPCLDVSYLNANILFLFSGQNSSITFSNVVFIFFLSLFLLHDLAFYFHLPDLYLQGGYHDILLEGKLELGFDELICGVDVELLKCVGGNALYNQAVKGEVVQW